jgi:hypothetical protein
MSEDTDRIPVPTNGRAPHKVADSPDRPQAGPSDDAGNESGEVPREQTVGFTPNQLAAGFGIVAGLLLLFAARRRRGRD